MTSSETDGVKKVRVVILDARYHQEQGVLKMEMELPDGTRLRSSLPFTLFTFSGKPARETPRALIDAEMGAMAETLREPSNRIIDVDPSWFPKGVL